jgi:hypothetical protein
MLHLITPLYRFQNVEKVYASITNYPDVTWHIGKSASKPYTLPFEDDRVKVYDVNCKDTDPVAKRNFALSKVKDGHFHLLDDDTVLHPGMYKLYKQMEEIDFKGMVIGKQIEKSGAIRLKEELKPIYCKVDAGNVICHHSAIHHILNHPNRNNQRTAPDYLLWELAYDYFKDCKMTEDVISVYNFLK